ncbi:SET domain-containing protein [Streptomyces mirabilis]|uniref:SET domain-containing protein n=1 Tax=Streptomyces mirabilis TaxID=68239 RepID=UPI0033CB8DBD
MLIPQREQATMDNGIELRGTQEKGEGVFATQPFQVDETVMVGVIDRELDRNHSHASQVSAERFVLHDGLVPKVNHSCEPNCGIRLNASGAHDYVARASIAVGDESRSCKKAARIRSTRVSVGGRPAPGAFVRSRRPRRRRRRASRWSWFRAPSARTSAAHSAGSSPVMVGGGLGPIAVGMLLDRVGSLGLGVVLALASCLAAVPLLRMASGRAVAPASPLVALAVSGAVSVADAGALGPQLDRVDE